MLSINIHFWQVFFVFNLLKERCAFKNKSFKITESSFETFAETTPTSNTPNFKIQINNKKKYRLFKMFFLENQVKFEPQILKI